MGNAQQNIASGVKGCKKLLRIGVFFDGTNNNAINDNKPASQKEEYANDPTNVVKLSELYKTGAETTPLGCEAHYEMLYINGVGTIDNDPDGYMTGLAMGSGGALRINQMIADVVQVLSKFKDDQYKDRIIDVFGFSRGATMARDFINTFNREQRFDHRYEFGFVGLYDSVSSFGVAGNDINFKPTNPELMDEHEYNWLSRGAALFDLKNTRQAHWKEDRRKAMQAQGLNDDDFVVRPGYDRKKAKDFEDSYYSRNERIQAIEDAGEPLWEPYNFNLAQHSAAKIVHLTALNEYRENFPLSLLDDATPYEYGLLGIHCDIGGAYPPSYPDKHEYKKVFLKRADAEAHSQKFLKEKQDDRWNVSIERIDSYSTTYQWTATLERDVTNDLDRVGLRMMLHLADASMAGDMVSRIPPVPFNPPSGDDAIKPPVLQAYYSELLANPNGADSSVHKDEILKTFAHHSAADPKDVLHGRVYEDATGTLKSSVTNAMANTMRYVDGKPKRMTIPNALAKAIRRSNA